MEILRSEIKDVIKKKQFLVEACENLDQEFVNIISEAEKNNDMRLVIKGKCLKRKSEEKCMEVETLDKTTFWKRKGKIYSEQILLFISFHIDRYVAKNFLFS